MIVGNKKSFAVEFTQSESNPEMGLGKIWIQNQFYGTNEDLIYFNGYLISLLDELLNLKTVEFNHDNLSELELFNFFENIENENDYLINGSTFTDDFTAYGFENKGYVYLIWKMKNDQEILFSDLKNYGTDLKFCYSEKAEIEKIKIELLEKVSIQNRTR